jgi:hypothetical protein
MITNRVLAGLALATLVAGCGVTPEKIEPSPISATAYRRLTCAELAEERRTLEAKLPQLYGKQSDHNSALTTAGLTAVPTLGLSTLLIPSLYPTRDRQDDIARVKGEIAAIDGVRADKACAT